MIPPPTWYSAARLTSPSSTIDAFAVVPPMSKVMSLPSPRRRARACAPTTPAAGPDSMMWIGGAAAAPSVMSPPVDCMIKRGGSTPAPPGPAPQPRRPTADERLDLLLVRGVGVGVDQADGECLDALSAEPLEPLL